MDNSILTRLAEWLETWRMGHGAYNGFVIHRYAKKRMFRIHDTAWTQAAIIRGYTNLYLKDSNPTWQKRMELAADLQCSRFDFSTGKYQYAGHEDDRFCSLVHCALANCALLLAYAHVDDRRKQNYLAVVRCNVDVYCEKLWINNEKAYKFSEIDYWSKDEDRFVINFNMMAAENLILLWKITNDQKYRDRALQLGEWLISHLDRTRMIHSELLKDKITVLEDPASEWMAHGGLPYQFTCTQTKPDNCVLIYAGLAMRGISSLYKITNDKRYSRILKETGDYLMAMRDSETRLFFHTTHKGRIEKYPQFISGIGMMLIGLQEARELIKADWDWSDTLQTILNQQYQNGSFPSFYGKKKDLKGKYCQGMVWEDAVAAVNWNAQLFEYLTIADYRECNLQRRRIKKRMSFIYYDHSKFVLMVSMFPINYVSILLCIKKLRHSLIAFFPYDIYMHSKFRKYLKILYNKLCKILSIKT